MTIFMIRSLALLTVKCFDKAVSKYNMRHCGFDTANNIVKVLSNFIMCSGFDDRFINLKIIQIYNTTFSVLMAVLSVKCIVITPTISFSVPEIYHWSYVGGLWFGNYYDFVFTMLLYVSPTPFVFITKIWNSLSLKSPTVVEVKEIFQHHKFTILSFKYNLLPRNVASRNNKF